MALEILRLADDEQTTVGDLAAVIAQDPAAAARLLKYVNSPLAGVPRQIASLSQAVVLLGLQAVKSIALGFSLMSQNRQGPCAGFDYAMFWSESVARAVAARAIALKLKTTTPDEAFTSGLLCQIGRLAFATAYPGSYTYALAQIDADDCAQLIEIEHDVFDIDHNELAAEMMTDWRLPAFACDAVRWQDSPEVGSLDADSLAVQLAGTLELGGAIATILTRSKLRRTSLTFANQRANRLGIKPDAFAPVFDFIRREWPTIGPIFDVVTWRVPPLVELYSDAR